MLVSLSEGREDGENSTSSGEVPARVSKRLSYSFASVLVIFVALVLPPSASLPLRAATVQLGRSTRSYEINTPLSNNAL